MSLNNSDSRLDNRFRIGLVMNPLAGIGGPVALKGSDGSKTVERALLLGAISRVADRTRNCLGHLLEDVEVASKLEIVTWAGEMGADVCESVGLKALVVGEVRPGHTTPADTCDAVRYFASDGVDLVLFAGGDGTARDVCDVIPSDQPVLGIPCGVKMHSGVFANNPQAAAEIIKQMVRGELVSIIDGEVRDIDEEAFRQGIVRARYYGEMLVPDEVHYLQHCKSGGLEVEALVLEEIAAHVVDNMLPEDCYCIGSGSTTALIMDQLGLDNTLLGVDVVRNGTLLKSDATAADLLALCGQYSMKIVVSIIGGQGHLFGRGNQQLSPALLRQVGRENVIVIATKEKLKNLESRPLLLDTGDEALDHDWSGYISVVTGYEASVLYRLSA